MPKQRSRLSRSSQKYYFLYEQCTNCSKGVACFLSSPRDEELWAYYLINNHDHPDGSLPYLRSTLQRVFVNFGSSKFETKMQIERF
jgi:hypothetical protein